MQAISTVNLFQHLSPLRLVGPIFDKELRVASRQRKNYTIRSVYVVLLTFFVAGGWLFSTSVRSASPFPFQASRMGVAAAHIAVAVVWFQFVTAQFLASVLLGDAIGGEIRKRTLHMLAVTPISSMQIAAGKLAGGLLHVGMLLAVSLPLLAMVRVFGAVSYDYVVSGVYVAFTATTLTGAITLFVSTFPQRSRGPIVLMLWFCVLGRFFDVLAAWLARVFPVMGVIADLIATINPTDILLALTQDMLAARSNTSLSSLWPVYCLIPLAGSLAFLFITARRIRTIAATPGSERMQEYVTWDSTARVPARGSGSRLFFGKRTQLDPPIRRVKGSPILWHEFRKFVRFRSRRTFLVNAAVVGIVCVGLAVAAGVCRDPALIMFIMVSGLIGVGAGGGAGLGMVAAGGISKERESRTLPVLLTTTLDDRVILKDKAVAALLWCLPFAAMIVVVCSFSLLLLYLMHKVQPLTAIWGMGLCLVTLLGMVPFFIGLGLYCSARLKTTASATTGTLCVSWGVIMFGCLVWACAIYVRMGGLRMWVTTSVLVLLGTVLCGGSGLILLRAATRRLRNNVF